MPVTVRHGGQTDSTIILTALGVDLEGNKEVLALRACAEEDKDGWSCLLQDLRRRGATQMELIVTDGHKGLLSAICVLFTATPRQRCLVHKQRNVMNAIAHREQKEVASSYGIPDASLWACLIRDVTTEETAAKSPRALVSTRRFADGFAALQAYRPRWHIEDDGFRELKEGWGLERQRWGRDFAAALGRTTLTCLAFNTAQVYRLQGESGWLL
jgi:hypothetical protein